MSLGVVLPGSWFYRLEVLGKYRIRCQRHREAIGLALHVRAGQRAQVLDQQAGAAVELLVEVVHQSHSGQRRSTCQLFPPCSNHLTGCTSWLSQLGQTCMPEPERVRSSTVLVRLTLMGAISFDALHTQRYALLRGLAIDI